MKKIPRDELEGRDRSEVGDRSAPRDELAVLEKIEGLLPGGPDSEVWIGDDAAVIDLQGRALLASVDLSVEGVHFDMGISSYSEVGWKALATAVSDIAAMGGEPLRCLVGFSCGHDIDIEGLYEGLVQAADRYNCPIVGGDISGGGALVISVAVTGSMSEGARPVLRSGARPGNLLYTTGPLGGSAYGLRLLRQSGGELDIATDPGSSIAVNVEDAAGGNYKAAIAKYRRPEVRIEEGRAAGLAGVNAMMDISDGLALDLHRMMAASGTGAEIEHVPVFAGATLEDALGGGEDYELLMATGEPDYLMEVFSSMGLPAPLQIGRCTDTPGDVCLNGQTLPPYGYTHSL